MHGITKPIEFDVTYGGKINTGRGEKAGFKILGQVNRHDFGLNWNNTVPTGELIVGDMIDNDPLFARVRTRPDEGGRNLIVGLERRGDHGRSDQRRSAR